MKVKNIFSGFTKAQKFYKRAIDSAKKRISPESNQIITDLENALEIFTQKAETVLALLKAQSPKATKKLQKVKTQSQEGGYIERYPTRVSLCKHRGIVRTRTLPQLAEGG